MSCSNEIPIVEKDPDAAVYFGLDWTDRLADGVTLSSSDWDVPSGITEDAAQLTTPIAKIKLSGGTEGATYDIVNEVVYSTGEIDQQTLRVKVRQR